MIQLSTFTLIPAAEISSRLAEPFDDPKAYKGVPGAADLTDINTGHMLERITQVFGPKGVGWNFSWSAQDMEILNPLEKRVLARLKYALFSYVLFDEAGNPHPFEIQTSGANVNELTYAEEGARTSALGAAVKGLCFQLPVYKGLLDHHNAGKLSGGNGSQPGKNGNGTGIRQGLAVREPSRAPSPGPDSTAALAAVEQLGQYVLQTGTQSKGRLLSELSLRTLGWFALTMNAATPAQQADQEAALLYLAAKAVPLTEEEAALQQQALSRAALLAPATPAGVAVKQWVTERVPA